MVLFCVQHQDDRTLATVLSSWDELFCARADLSYAIFFYKNTTRGAAFLRNTLNTLCETVLNSFLLRFLATKIVTNESWIIRATLTFHNPENNWFLSRMLTSFRLFTMSFSFRQSCNQLPWHRGVRFSRARDIFFIISFASRGETATKRPSFSARNWRAIQLQKVQIGQL